MIHILIVDDNEDSRLILKKTLESEGHIVEKAINGEEALQTARKSPPDVIISDILMPVMDGFQFCMKCKTDDGLKDIPFVFYTATYTDEKDEEAALKMGADRFIRKPVEPDELIKIIQGVIRDVEKGGIKSGKPVVAGEKDVLKLYSERLVNKLEKKMLDLEREIARRKQGEETLRKSEKRLRRWSDLLPQTVFETDERGKLIFVNRNAYDTFGYTREDFDKGLTVIQMIAPEDRDRAEENIQKLSSGEKTDGIEYTAQRKNGGTFPVIVYSSPIIPDDKVLGLRGILVDITDRKHAEEEIKRSLREKETLLAEIHHRVKNNMQIVSSLLSLQSNDIEDERALSLIKNCEDRIRSMSLVHEKLYLSKDLSSIDFHNYMEDLSARLFQVHRVDSRVVSFSSQIKDVSFNIETAIPLGLIINELISNALKHAFPEGRKGNIEVKLTQNKKTEEYTLTVTDDGIGFPEGTDYRNTETFGLQLANMLTEQLNGTMELDRNKGTSIRITFKQQEYRKRI